MSSNRMVHLASKISASSNKIDEYLRDNDLPSFSFDESAPSSYGFPDEIIAAQETLSEALDELWWLNQGPIETVYAKSYIWSVGLKTILEFNIHNLVPLEQGTTFKVLAEKTGVSERKLTRLLRHGMTDRLLREPTPGVVKHTIATKALVSKPQLARWAEACMAELVPARALTVDAVAKWPDSEEPHHSGFNLANNTELPMFAFFEAHPERMKRFKDAMRFREMFAGLGMLEVVNGFDWASLGKATVVDIGGSHGLMSVEIARAFPELRFVVQDLPKVIEDARLTVPTGLSDRVLFQAHNFFNEQPIQDADIYFLRNVLHDWSDKYCVKILRALIPALKKGARVILNEKCLDPPDSITSLRNKQNRDSDIRMLAVANAQERHQDDWKELFHVADSRFQLEEITKVEGSNLYLIIVRWC